MNVKTCCHNFSADFKIRGEIACSLCKMPFSDYLKRDLKRYMQRKKQK